MSYRDDFRSAERETYWTAWRVILLLFFISAVIGTGGYFLGWFSEGAQVAQEQFGPRAALKKYEWFIDRSNQIKKMDGDVKIFQARVSLVDSTYGSKKSMDLVTRQLYNDKKQQAETDLAAIISQRNNLVTEYNAQSEKFNWRPFNTRTDMPVMQFELIK